MFNRGLLSGPAWITVLAGLSIGAADAAVIVSKDNAIVDNIPGLTSFTTSGDMMGGMLVTATFSVGGPQTVAWGATGVPGAGGAFGTGWSLEESGDTFVNPWSFSFLDAGLGSLVSLQLIGTPGLTVFDTTAPSEGTPGSAQGRDFVQDSGATFDADVTYSNVVAIAGNAFVGDLYHVLFVDFGEAGPTGNFSFLQDTDNDSRLNDVPEPAMLGVLGLALVGFGVIRLRRPA